MIIKLAAYLKHTSSRLRLRMICVLLFLKNLVVIRTLRLNELSLYDKVVIVDNEIEILWNVRGCHKIRIKGVGLFPGNTYGLKFLFLNRANPIEITFYGIFKKLKRKISIEATEIRVLDKFIRETELPSSVEIPFNKQKFESVLSREYLRVDLQDISFQFEPFIQDNYESNNTAY